MPMLDYMIASEIELTKEMISDGLPRELTPTLDLGKDNRTWNKEQLKALKLILCNIIINLSKGNIDGGKFLYSRDKRQIPKRFNPNEVKYSSVLAVIDKLQDAKILGGKKHPPRKKGDVFDKDNPSKMSNFIATKQAIDFAISLGIDHLTIKPLNKDHVRLRELGKNPPPVEFEWDDWTKHIELLMARYNHYINKHCIILSTVNYESEGFSDFGHMGQEIHLHRNFRNYTSEEKFRNVIDEFWIEMDNPNFQFGGRSGGYWQHRKQKDREWIIVDGMKMKHCDYPAFHLQLCYLSDGLGWYQQETHDELKQEGREEEDAYYIHNVPRDLVKQMVLLMFNCKGRKGTSLAWSNWLRDKAKPELVRAFEFCGLTALEIMKAIEKRHSRIKHYFYKGKLAGQVIQWEEANFIHHIAMSFIEQHDFIVLTVFDELIVPEEHYPMVKEFMYTMAGCEICKKYSLMSQIKNL